MEFKIEKNLKGQEAVEKNELFGQAVFIECGYHNPQKYCFDHHVDGGDYTLSSAGMIHAELIQRRNFPKKIVMNHVRHLDNIMALFLLYFRALALHPDTLQLVSCADLIDRVGPLALSSVPQMQQAVLFSAQQKIPFKEWELSDEDLTKNGLDAIHSLKNMVTNPPEQVEYETYWESQDHKMIIASCSGRIGNTLYDQGYDAYMVYSFNKNGKLLVTLAKASNHVPFDLVAAREELKSIEPGWGGHDTVSGSPKPDGSALPLEKIAEVVKKHYLCQQEY